MKIQQLGFGRGVLLVALLLALISGRVAGQNAAIPRGQQENKVPARVTEAVDDTNRVALRGNVHPLARPEFDQGAVEQSRPMNRMLLLLQRSAEQESALQQLMEEQQRKDSPNFHAWLTPDQFGKQFGPADADIQAVTDWLTSQGFQVGKVSTGRTVIEFSGVAAQVQNAFHTEIHKFQVRGEEHLANVSDPEIPAALKPVVRSVVALHNFRPKAMLHRLGTFRRNVATGEVKPAFTFSDVNGTFYAMGPADFSTIYNIPTNTATGQGQSIAIVGQSNINLQDVRDFRTIFGLPANDPQVILNGPDPGLVSGDETESDLDVEWSGAVAPQAKIIFVTTQTTNTDLTAGVDASAMYIIDNNVAPVMSESYGSCEANLAGGGNAFYNALWQQAAAEGITVVISAGDNGSAGCDDPNSEKSATLGLAVSGFASTPYNVAVGGTDFDDAGNQQKFWNTANTSTTPPVPASALGYIPEIPWNDSCAASGITGCASVSSTSPSLNLVAGSGGPSNCATSTVSGSTVTCTAGYVKPPWQNGITPNDGVRDIPDVSFFAADGLNRSFYVVCESDQDIPGHTGCNLTKFSTTTPFHDFQAVGGTSASAPAFAGIMALVNQTTGQRQGNANYALYNTYSQAKTAGTVCNSSTLTGSQLTSNTCVFYDTTKGNISVACTPGKPDCSNTGTTGFGVMTTIAGGTILAYNAGAGYDLATGLGSINVANLLAKWATPTVIGTNTTLVGPSTATLNTSITFSGTVTKASGTGTPTGLVVLEDVATGAVIDRATLSAGTYSITTPFLPAATSAYQLIAHYGGDGTFGPSDSAALTMTAAKQPSKVLVSFVTFTGTNGTTPVLSTAAQSVSYGSPYILRVDVTNSSGTPCENFSTRVVSFVCPIGSVQLFNNTQPLNDFPVAQTPNATNVANLNDRGFAEDQPIQLAPGAYSITAAYTAGANSSYTSNATSNTLAVTVTKATTAVTVTSSPATIVSGGSVTLTAKITTTSNGAGPTGTVQFMNGSTALGSPVTCTPTAAGATAASCTATLTTKLSQFIPPPMGRPRPRVPLRMIWIIAYLLLAFALGVRLLPAAKRRYAYAGLLLFAVAAAGIAGCNGTTGGSSSNTRTITATYSGDANYSGSSGTASVTVQ